MPTTSDHPETQVDPRFSLPDSTPTPWEEGRAELEKAEVFWLTTVRGDGRPHVTPLLAVWDDGALHFSTGPGEQKAKNLEGNQQIVLTTGTNSEAGGLDVVVEGRAERVTDEARLRELAELWVAKYGEFWRFDVRDQGFHSEGGGLAYVFAVRPPRVFGFRKGAYSQTRWTFSD